MSIVYRKDIDGLRALAVLSVIVFHANSEWLPGGFLGVEIFFVISGYLITLLLLKDLQTTSRFNITNFYQRRIRRIMPALLTVIVTTLIAGLLLFTPDKLITLSKDTLWSLFFLANFPAYEHIKEAALTQDNTGFPLLHLWSLGVEEQFYLLWPVALYLMHRLTNNTRKQTAIVTLLLILSFLLAYRAVQTDRQSAYFMLASRTWQLMTGCLLALMSHTIDRAPRTKNSAPSAPVIVELVTLVALIAIVMPMFILQNDHDIPGFSSLPAIVGCATIIWIGREYTTKVSYWLSMKPFVLVGLCSYSAYLWHWPILVFIQHLYGDTTPISGTLALLATAVLSALTYRFIENPARYASVSHTRLLIIYLLAPVIVLSLACFAIQHTFSNRFPLLLDLDYYDAETARLTALTQSTDNILKPCAGKQSFNESRQKNAHCVFPANANPDAILTGDFHAHQALGALQIFANKFDFSFRSLTQENCALLFDSEPLVGIPDSHAAACSEYRKHILGNIAPYRTVIIGGTWASYDQPRSKFRQRFESTIKSLVASGKQVIILGELPAFSDYFAQCDIRALRAPWLDCSTRYIQEQRDYETNLFLQQLAERYDGVDYFSLRQALCDNRHCSPYFHGNPVYTDKNNLSYAGSKMLAEHLLNSQDPALDIFSRIANPQKRN